MFYNIYKTKVYESCLHNIIYSISFSQLVYLSEHHDYTRPLGKKGFFFGESQT